MRNKKLISMLLLPAAFVACTDDFVEDGGYVGNKLSQDAIEDYVLNVTFDEGSLSRAAYAGDSLGNPYQNFYLEPEYDGGKIKLGNYEGLAGDMMGYCLTNGANAITNLPFYIAGYSSANDSVIYSFSDSGLYDLGEVKKDSTVLHDNSSAGTIINNAIAEIAKKPAGAALSADSLDPRKGIVRTNAGIMTGDYIAYFPYNEDWTEPSGIPAVAMDDLYEVGNLSDDRKGALEAVNFYNYLFAVSQQANQVKGGTKSGDVSLKPLTSALTFKLVYTAEIEEGEDETTDTIKRITIRTAEEGAAGFTLQGKVALNSLGAITASKSTDLIGVSFPAVELDTASVKYVTIPFYPNPAITGYVIEVYNNKGQVAAIEKATAKFELGKGYLTTVDFKDLKFANTTRKIFSKEDFVEEAVSGGDLQLMVDVNVDNATDKTFSKDLNIKGAKKLTLATGTYNGKLAMAAGSHLVLNGAAVENNISADTLSVNAVTTFDSSKTIEASTFNNNVAYNNDNMSATTLTNATIGVLNNKLGSWLYVSPIKATESTSGTAVTIDKLNNNGKLYFNGTGTPYVKELNILENAGEVASSQGTVTTSLKADVINISAGKSDNPQTTTVNEKVIGGLLIVQGKINAEAVINNNWQLTYYNELNSTVNNYGSLNLQGTWNFGGVINNKGYVYVIDNSQYVEEEDAVVESKIEGVAGEVNNESAGVIDIQGYFGFTSTKLNINSGKVIVNGSINGNSNITVAEGAEFIATAANENVLLSTLGTSFINAKYTGIKVTSEVWPASVTATAKKIYLGNSIEFKASTALNGGLVIEGNNVNVKAEGKELTASAVTINSGAKLKIGTKTNVTVNGTITNNGTYEQESDAVVWCGAIAGTGTWTNKPNY